MKYLIALILSFGGLLVIVLTLNRSVTEINYLEPICDSTHICTDSTHQTCDEECFCDSVGCDLKPDTK